MNIIHRVRKHLKNSRGSAAIEFAIIMPVLVLFLSGIFELCMFALLNNKLVRIAGTMGDLVSMQNINLTTLQGIIATAPDMAQPFTYTGQGNVIVSLVYNNGQTTDPTKMLISWQQADSATVNSNFGKPGQRPTNLPNNITVINDETLVLTEVFYNYVPFIFTNIIPAQTLYKTSVYVPRSGDMVTLLTP